MFLVALAGMSWPAAAADDPRMRAPTGLIITYHAEAADRPALRAAMLRDQVARLDALKRDGIVAHYRLLWSRYADNLSWDGMLILDLATPTGIGGWARVEAAAPGALPVAAARLVKRIESAPIDIMRAARAPTPGKPLYLVVPYDYLVSVGDYVKYVDGYVVPQMDGWLAEGALQGYDFLLSRYPAGRPWTAMLLLQYRGDDGLGIRDATTAKVRARLASDPAWKAFADNKQNIREERAPIVADVLAER
jgi:hypothetical protein